MRRHSRFGLKLLGVFLVFALLAAACGDDDDAATTTTAAATTTTAAPGDGTTAAPEETTTTATPVPATTAAPTTDQIIISLSTDINILEQHLFRSTGSYAVTRALYQPLLDQEYVDAEGVRLGTSTVVPSQILSSYEVAGDGTATFTINPDAKFASGDPITAQDAVYMMRRSIDRAVRPVHDVPGVRPAAGNSGGRRGDG